MNSAFKITLCAVSFAVSTSLVSCQKDALPTPVGPEVTNTHAGSDVAVQSNLLAATKKYTLVKEGPYELSYNADGKIVKVKRSNFYTDYEHSVSPAYVKATSYSTNSGVPVKYKVNVISLNPDYTANTGWVRFYDNTGAVSMEYYVDYDFVNQHLVKYREDGGSARSTEFTYDGDGELSMVTQKFNGTIEYQNLYSYTGYGPMQTDYHPQNPLHTTFDSNLDQGTELLFLPIFGKFHKHLVQSISRIQSSPYKVLFNYRYKYTLNADGRVTERERWDQTINQKLTTDSYQYIVELLVGRM
ncbi:MULTISPECIES: hypothetical protein [unclassified Spirosoma]|uniref:hypothetical protein n=1 Tax=unclassified Spirosoma TaxID=2621999 RepID=UPI000959E3F6|nr:MULTISPECIES: hypothetical protein [unclassified Spirosoma]MBN8822612.1 hypothetical protein [Spirosoma sp.]OJW74104.1 MAG: hypothetical protein BGO59_13330 [Spirosoma sp. 48-14]